jgi:hypothetical protein
MPSTAGKPNEKWAWFIVGGISSIGFVLGTANPGRLEPVIERTMAFGLIIAGLSSLFLLAAFGPKTDTEKVSRVRSGAVGVGMAILGVSELLPSFWLRAVLGGLSLLIMLAALLKAPKGLFVPPP